MKALAGQAPSGSAPLREPWLRASLVRVLHEVLGDPRARRFALHPARAAGVRFEPRPPRSARAPDERLAAAERELVSVHRIELALLLREAARLRVGGAGGAAGGDAGGRDVAAGGEPERACRRGLEEALDCARRDGLSFPVRWTALASRCVLEAPTAWPPASVLAGAALEAEPCEAGRAVLSLALEAEGDPLGATRALAAALLTCPSAARGALWLGRLARLEQGLGHAARARVLRRWAQRTREVA